MGIQDRDYYREHCRTSSGRLRADVRHLPGRSKTPLGVVLSWLVIGFVVFVVFDHWVLPKLETHQSSLRANPGTAPAPSGAVVDPSPPTTTVHREAPSRPSLDQPGPRPPAATIFRCGDSYGTTPCPNGRAVDRPAASGFDTTPSVRLAGLVGAGRSAEASTNTTTSTTTITTTDGLTTTTVSQASNAASCDGLSARVHWIDAEARRPQTLPMQDWLRAQRQQVRGRQAALRC